jgi:predicted permease
MRWWEKFRMRVRMLLGRGQEAERLDRELEFHLEQQIAENMAAGMSEEEARYAALRLFGNPVLLREQSREAWSWNGAERLVQDVRFALRQIARAPGFARGALGASRGRVMRQLLVESLMLAVPGAVVGTGLAWLAGPWLLHGLGNSEAEISLSVRPDGMVLAITAGCACLCAVLFGMAPAWIASRTRLEAMLRGGRGASRGGSALARRILIPLQLALSVSLIVVAALLGSTVVHLRTDSTGFHAKNVIFYIADFWRLPQKGADLVALYRRILPGLEAQPGVESASVTEILPFYGWRYEAPFTTDADPRHAKTVEADVNEIGAHYFATVGTRLLAGRDLRDDDGDLHSCVIDERAAEQYFRGGSALGKWLHQVWHNLETGVTTIHDCEIVGIVENTKYDTMRETPPAIVYMPISADTGDLPGLFFAIHARSFDAARAAYHKVIHEMAPLSPETDPATLEGLMSDSMAREQLLSALSGFFAALALLLSGIGIYGLVAWNVAQRIPEIGVRMALGATRLRVFLLVLRQIVVLMAIGLAAGGAAAFFAARSVSSFLYEIPANSPAVYLLAGAVLAAIGLLAACIPARHAVRIDPMEALRTE